MSQPSILDAIPLNRAPTSIRDLLMFALAPLRQQAVACDVTLTVSVEDLVPARMSVDRDKIAWVVAALVGNALRYVRRGSRMMPGGLVAVRATYEAASDHIVIEIEDDGPGIPVETLRSMSRSDVDAPGSALGLKMVRDVVAGHHGTCTIESETNRSVCGTRVRFTLPAA